MYILLQIKELHIVFLFYFVLTVLISLYFDNHQVLAEKNLCRHMYNNLAVNVQLNVVNLPDPSSFVTLDRVEVMYLSIFFLYLLFVLLSSVYLICRVCLLIVYFNLEKNLYFVYWLYFIFITH